MHFEFHEWILLNVQRDCHLPIRTVSRICIINLGPENNLNNNSLAHESEGVSVYCSCMMTLDSGYGASWWFGCKSIFTSLLKRPKVCGQMSGLDFIVHCSIGSDPVPIDDIAIADQLQFDCGCDHSCSLRLRWRNKIRCLFACCWLVNRWWLFGS